MVIQFFRTHIVLSLISEVTICKYWRASNWPFYKMEIQIPPEEELTEFAKRYGEGPRGKFKDTKKPGVTPVDPLPPAGPVLSVESWEIRKLIEAAQRKKLSAS